MSEAVTVNKERAVTEYEPLGSKDKIKLHVGIVQNLIAVKTKSGKTCSETDAIKFIAMCQAKRINPLEGDAYLIGYDGRDGATFTLVTAHQTYLKRAELHPEFDGMESGVIVRDKELTRLMDLPGDFYMDTQELVGAWATVHFKTRKHPMSKRLKLSTFRKPFGVWNDNPGGMIVKCAEADALRSAFPTMLGGLYLREELSDIPSDNGAKAYAKPLFQSPPANGGAEALPEPTPETRKAESDLAPAPLIVLRAKMSEVEISDADVLHHCMDTGLTNGDVGTMEELSVAYPGLLTQLIQNWPVQSADILKRKAGK